MSDHVLQRNDTDGLVNSNGSMPQYGPAMSIAASIESYAMPFICGFGLIGNTLAAITFLKKSMRGTSCSIFLAARSVSDNGFLFTLTLIWISGTFNLNLSRVLGLCQVNVFLSFVCGCVSVWLVVFVTTENYIRICHAHLVKRFCTTRRAYSVILVLCFIVLSIYHVPLWISKEDCSPSMAFYEITQAFVYTDTVLTFLLPTLLMTILLIVITYHMVLSFRRRDRLKVNQLKSRRDGQTQANPMAQVTKMLLAVSLIFFTLNLPSHVVRLRVLINSFRKGRETASDPTLQTITLLIYYLSLAINIIIYLFFGKNFRREFKKTFLPKSLRPLCTRNYEMVESSAVTAGTKSVVLNHSCNNLQMGNSVHQ